MNKVITIGREFGSGGRELGVRLAKELGFAYYDKEIITAIVNQTEYAESYVNEMIESNSLKRFPITIGQSINVNVDYQIRQMQTIVKAQTAVIKEMALKSDCVIVGRCSDYILKDVADEGQIELIRLFVYADADSRLKRCISRAPEDENLTPKQIEKQIKSINKERAAYYEDYTLQKWGDKKHYDLCINTSNIEIKTIVPNLAKLFQ